ncbi:asparagine synthase-related protein [Novosphingobium naphthalenivorans]|uniref:asparagine synthase-related protein n=1 Tax=Novosphingobium naphthalenivorans TaxID=273168 RepID=UPI00082CADE6|nr:asparagine synthase-related protein [Novosphingobium naphthalenivorans]
MSAIWGLLRFDGASVAPGDLKRMGAALRAFGPDASETLSHDSIGLGHNLLIVNREDRFEAQPLHDHESRLSIVADLRLDNREELAAELGLEGTANWPDSAFVAPAYRRWGEDFAAHLLGDFVIAIWDAPQRRLLLARDHMGQRGVYWHKAEDFFAFAREPEALWQLPDIPRCYSEASLGRLITLCLLPRDRIEPFKGLHYIERSTLLIVEADGAIRTHRYWQPQAAAEHIGRDETYYRETYERVLTEAVSCRVRRLETPPALLFSGAFDSGLVAAIAGPIAQARGHKVIALSSVLPPGETRPGLEDARAAVEAWRDCPWLEIHLHTHQDNPLWTNPEAYFAEFGSIGLTQPWQGELAQTASACGARLLMTGMGGDYTVHPRARWMLGKWLRTGHWLRFTREAMLYRQRSGRSLRRIWSQHIAGSLVPLSWQRRQQRRRFGAGPAWSHTPIASSLAERLLAEGEIDDARVRTGRRLAARWRDTLRDTVESIGIAQLPGVAAAGRLGLDYSYPFHDRRVVELGLALPDSLLFRDGIDRWLPRTVFANRLPAALLAHTGGNTTPGPDYFRFAQAAAPALLETARAMDHDGRISAYVDLTKAERLIASADEHSRMGHDRLLSAVRALVAVRYKLWLDGTNR